MATAAKKELLRVAARKEDPIELNCQERVSSCCRFHWKGLLTPIVFLIWLPVVFASSEHRLAMWCLYMLLLMLSLALLELMPYAVISIVPLVVVPMSGILPGGVITGSFTTTSAFVLMGSIWISTAIVLSKLNNRIGLCICKCVGFQVYILLAFLMVMSFLCSLILNQVFVCAIMYTIVDVILAELEVQQLSPVYDKPSVVFVDDEPPKPSKISVAFYLGVAYGCLTGGNCSWFGSTMLRIYGDIFKSSLSEPNEDSVYKLALFNLPISLCLFFFSYFWLAFVFIFIRNVRKDKVVLAENSKEVLQQRIDNLGRMKKVEVGVLAFVIITIILMITRQPLFTKGWGDLLKTNTGDETITVLTFVLMNLFPVTCASLLYCICKRPNPEGTSPSLSTPKGFSKVTPWASYLVICCGAAVAATINASGLLELYRYLLNDHISNHTLYMLIILVGTAILQSTCLSVPFAYHLLPVVLNSASGSDIQTGKAGVVTLSTMMNSFIFPMSNGVVCLAHTWGNVRIWDLMLAGFPLTILALVLTFLFSFLH